MHALLYHIAANKLELLDQETVMNCVLASDSPDCPHQPLHKTDPFIWIDLHAGQVEELEALAKRFHWDPQLVEDVQGKEGRPKLHDYEDYIYLVFHAIHLDCETDGRMEVRTSEIDCVLGPDWLVTVHPSHMRAFHDVAKRWKHRPEWMRGGPGHLLYELMDAVLDAYFPVLEKLDDRIDEFEGRLYRATEDDGPSQPISGEIFALKRALLQIRHIAGPTRDVANVLLRRDSEAGGHHFAAYQDLYDHAARIVENIDTYRDMLSGALDAYLAVESNRMNAVMKRFTAYSMILLFPSLIAGIYGMNFGDMPNRHGFWDALGVMGAVVCGLLIYFKRRGWM